MRAPSCYGEGNAALVEGTLDVVSGDHSRYVGWVGAGPKKLVRLQGGETEVAGFFSGDGLVQV